MGYVFLFFALFLNSIANVLLKIGSGAPFQLTGGLIQVVREQWIALLGLFLFACNVIFYLLALNRLPLSQAYPVMAAGSLCVIVFVSSIYLKESLSPLQLFGVSLLVVGILLVTFKGY